MTKKNKILVFEKNGVAYTDSITIANKFGKRHEDVIRAIENMECSSQFWNRNFAVSKAVQSNKVEYKIYEMTWKGYSFVVMGFTGKAAGQFKEEFIEAFDKMQSIISLSKENQKNRAWVEVRENGKIPRKMETDSIQRLVIYAVKAGSTKANHYYSLITNMEYKALFYFIEALPKPNKIREVLSELQLIHLATAESIVSKIIDENIELGTHYKDIYTLCKKAIEQFASMVGVTPIPVIQGDLLKISKV